MIPAPEDGGYMVGQAVHRNFIDGEWAKESAGAPNIMRRSSTPW
jgi:hypothetical protein